MLHRFEDLTSLENLLLAWEEFICGKRGNLHVQRFARNLMDNIIALHEDLANKTYCHGVYKERHIWDPKPRLIHVAPVRDRLLHHAIYRVLYPFFDRTFVGDTFSCRVDKGVHKALNRFRAMAYRVSHNHTRTCWVLKCDIRKFFASIDHQVLMQILHQYIPNQEILGLLERVVLSFSSEGTPGVGLPLGNLTSQLFANVYMNEFDQFVKHRLKTRYYIRYADDFVLLSHDCDWIARQIPAMYRFLYVRLHLVMHPEKITLKTIASGVDFLGWVHFSDHRVLRSTTKRRMMRHLQANPTNETLQSYFGLIQHGNTQKVQKQLLQWYWLYS